MIGGIPIIGVTDWIVDGPASKGKFRRHRRLGMGKGRAGDCASFTTDCALRASLRCKQHVILRRGTWAYENYPTSSGGTVVNAGTLQLGDGIVPASLMGSDGSNGIAGGAGTDAVTVNNSAVLNVMAEATIPGGNGGVGGGDGVDFTGAAGTLTNQSGGTHQWRRHDGYFANAVTLYTGSVIKGILNLGTSTAATLILDGGGTQLYSTAVTGPTSFNGALIKNGTGTMSTSILHFRSARALPGYLGHQTPFMVRAKVTTARLSVRASRFTGLRR